ncbi:sensor histidine kinase [Emergencia sp.]|uniref:sensor histidine kinase n=1 Tax=Emergencia sp. TaxID=1926557 RepID=UPI003AEF73D2
MSENNNKMTSIARRINFDFWLKQFANFLMIDVVLIVLIAVTFFVWRENAIPEGAVVDDRYFTGDEFRQIQYIIKTETGKLYGYSIYQVFDLIRLPAIVFLVIQGLTLIGELFNTKKVRMRMRPLNDIAIKTEQLSHMALDSEKFENFEQAISNLNPEMPDAKVHTGDQDLQSLEIAINNLLARMRESHRQQDRFVSDASHELRTPISVIQGYVNMLDRWGKEDEQILDESIEAIKNESENMKNLIEQLLFLARGDSGRNTLHFEDFDLTETVKDVWEESIMIDEKHIYQFEGKEQITVNGDMSMIKQSLRILVQNAAKYSKEGDGITLKSKIEDGRPCYVVQDEGIGMAESEVIHVFERFYRAGSARNSAEGGSGLGLSIAKWIVDAHGGTIEILSRPEFGTRFTVKL